MTQHPPDVIYPQYYSARLYPRGVMLDLFGYTGDVPDPQPGEQAVQSAVGLSWSHLKGLAQFMVALVEQHEHEHGLIEVNAIPPARHHGAGEQPH